MTKPAPLLAGGWSALAKARNEAGYATQKDLATELGVRAQTVGTWEGGTRQPQQRHLKALALALGRTDAAIVQLLEGVWTERSEPVPGDPDPADQNERTARDHITASARPGSVVHQASGESEAAAFRTAVIEGLRFGYAGREPWLATARATAKLLGVPWDEG